MIYSFIILDTKFNQNSVGDLLLRTHIVVYNSNSNNNVVVVNYLHKVIFFLCLVRC